MGLNRFLLFLVDWSQECNILGSKGDRLYDLVQYILDIIMIAVPILVVVLVTVDFVRAVVAGKEEDMKKAQGTAIKRIVIGVVIFFIPVLVNVILKIIGITSGTCGIG